MATDPSSHFPVDKSVIVPPAVLAAGATADAMIQALQPPAMLPPQVVQPGAPPQPVVPPQAPDMAALIAAGPPPPAGWTLQAQPVQAPQPQQPQQIVTQPGNDDQTWEQRFRTERGRREAMERNFGNQQGALQQQVNDLMRQLDDVRNGRAPPAGGGPVTIDRNLISAEARKTWGDEMCDFVLETASKIAAASAGQVTQQVDQRLQQSQQQMWQAGQMAMMSMLDERLPDGNGRAGWRIVNDDAQFGNWLQERDGFSSLSRQQILRQAWEANDTETVYRVFAAYMTPQPLPIGQGGPGAPQGGFPPMGGSPQPSQRLPLHNLAAPGPTRQGQASAPGGPEPNYYTQSQIAKFFQDKGRGLYNDTPQRMQFAQAIEVDIFDAQKTGRVVPG